MPRTSPVHYINPTCISITPNANGSANDLAVYVAKGAQIQVYSRGIAELGMDDATWQQWTLTGRNRRLQDSTKPYTIYARLFKYDWKREGRTFGELGSTPGYLIFAPKEQNGDTWMDKYAYVTMSGLASGTANKNNAYFWYVKLGDVSLPEDGQRTVTLDTGILGTDLYNTEWNLNPDQMPLRVELTATIDGEDAGDKPYVPWGKNLALSAKLVEGWSDTDVEKFHHWTIQRNTGDSANDVAWNFPDATGDNPKPSLGREMSTGSINLGHTRGEEDVFNGTVSSTWTVIAWGLKQSDSEQSESGSATSDTSSGSSDDDELYEALAQTTINILAETEEQYALELSSNVVNYDPSTDTYNPIGGMDVMMRATDQKGNVFKMAKAQVEAASLGIQYAVADNPWNNCVITDGNDNAAKTTIPVEAFHSQQNVVVRIVKIAKSASSGSSGSTGDVTYTEIYRTPIAFVRNGEDSKEREWVFLRSDTALAFTAEAAKEDKKNHIYLTPAKINVGEVKPEEAAGGGDPDKDQDGWVPQGWWDDMQGTNETFHYEYAAYRDYVKNAPASTEEGSTSSSSDDSSNEDASQRGGHWGDFSTPRIWSYYAEDAVTYRCRWTAADVEIYQLKCAYTGAYRGELPIVATLLKRVGSQQEVAAVGSTTITLSCDGIKDPDGNAYSKTYTAGSPTLSISEDNADTKDFIQYLNDKKLNSLSISFTIDGERHDFSIPVIREADEDAIKETIKTEGENYFLSKLHDDTAAGSITVNGDHSVGGSQTVMGSQEVGEGQTVGGTQNVAGLSSLLGGLTVGGKYGIDADGVATLAKAVVQVLKTAGYTDPSMTGAGAAMYEDEDRGFTVTDYLTVRIKAIFNELEIRRLSYVGGNYVFSHAGSRIITQAELDAAGLTGLKPVNEIKDGDTVTGWKVYFKADDGTTRTQNMWRVGDQALCQTFNIDKDSHENASNRYYWRLVTAAGSETVDGAETALDYVVLSNQATISGALTDGTDKFYPVGGDTSDDSSAKNLWQGYDDLSGTDTYRSGASIKGKLDITAPDTPAEGDTLVQVGCQADTRVLSTGETDGGICKERGGVVEIVTEGMGGEPCPAINIYSAINGYTWQAHKVMQMSADGMVGVAKYFSLRTDSLAGEPMALFNYRGEWSSDVAYSYGDCVVKDGQSWVWSDRAKSASASDIPGSSDGWHIASKQGNGGYSVWLSRYSSVLTVDDLGNPIGGIYTMSKDGVKQWRIATAIFARKGSDLLLVKGDGDPDEGHYTVAAWGDGCDIALDHSTVYVTKIHNMHDSNEQTTEAFDYDKMRRTNFCRVTITVCCEGKSTYTMEFPIRIAHDSLPFMLCDLSNQSLHVGWNTKETAYYGFPATTDVSVLYHNEPWAINSCTVDGVPAGLKAVVSDATDGKGKTITLSPDGSKTGDFLPSLTEMTVHVSAVYAGATYEYDKALTLDRKAGVTVYEIVPSSASITRYKDGTLSAGTLSVSVWATSSDNSRYKIEDLAAAGLTLTQAIGYTKGNAEPQGLFYTGPITLTGNETEAVFTLSDGNSNVLDKETVPFINEGKDGEKGDKGDDGKDAITLTASPSTLLLTEGATTSTDETTKETTYTAGSFDVQGVRLSLMRGDTEVTPDDWSASDIMGGLTVSRTAQGPAFSVWVQDKDKATAKKNEPLSFTAKATYNGKEYTARVNVVLNWQGTFQETTFTDINTRVSNKVVNTINEQGLVDKTTMNSAIEQSAKGITQTVAETYENKEDSTKKYSEVKQTAEGISLAVSRSSQGRNLIKGSRLLDKTSGVRVQDGQIVSGTDGTGCNGVAFTSSDATQYPGLYWAYDKESGSRCVPVTAGKKYMLSCWAKVSVDILTPTQPQVGVAGLMLGLELFAHKTSEGTSTNDGGDPRKEGQSEFFTVMSDGQWRLYSKVFTAAAGYGYAEATAVFNNTSGQQATMTVRQPILEELADGDDGSVYAGWTPATADMDNALLATGIDIRNRKITLTSDKVVVLDNSGNEQALLEGGKLSTRLIDTQGLTVGGIESRYSDDKTNYAKVEIKDGVINIWGRNSPNQHIEIGYDDDGNAVLKFYDKNGNLLYNLGPNGLDAPDITEPSLEMPRMKTWSTETAMKGDWAKVTGNELKYDDFSNQTWWRYTAGRVGTDITKDTPHELTQEQATALDGWFINWNNQSTDDLSSPADTAMKGGQLSGATFYALMEKDRMGDNNLFAIYKVVGGKPTVETRDYAGNLITGNS